MQTSATEGPGFWVTGPDLVQPRLPLVFDSPHSWRDWPAEVATVASSQNLQTGWDAFVDSLWAPAIQGRAPLLCARFHRALIDANRGRDDVDPKMLAEDWPTRLQPTEKSERGFGLVRRLILPNTPMYDRALGVAEVQQRLTAYYDPYHVALAALIDQTHARFGQCLHVNCHSMKSIGNAMNDDAGQPRPDMVVSDLVGTTAPTALTAAVADLLRGLGYRVNVNDPYKGGELVRRHACPAQKRYSLQIEINRALYMDEKAFTPSAGFEPLVEALRTFIGQLGALLAPTT